MLQCKGEFKIFRLEQRRRQVASSELKRAARIGRSFRMNAKPSAAADPDHVRAAPSHPDPYPYYGRLAREQPFFRDDAHGWWVAASAAAVTEVLTSDICFTRPVSEPIPT